MRRLIVMRHAKSDWSQPGQSDHARPLNARGQRSAEALGRWLKASGTTPELTLSSDATRTRQTFAGLLLATPVKWHARLYHAEAETYWDALCDVLPDTVMLLGHNPGIAQFAHTLLRSPPEHARFRDFPTGATLVVDLPAHDWYSIQKGTGVARAFVVPRDLI